VVCVTPAEFARHGGRLSAARSLFPHAPQPWIDLSTGINPWPYPAPRAGASARGRLPDIRDLQRLESLAAETFGVSDPARIAAIGGTECALRLLPYVLKLRRAVIAGPTYGSHADAWAQAGCEVQVVADEELDRADFPDSAVVVVNPNNPDGRVLSPARLQLLHERVSGCGGRLIIDESFAEVTPRASIADIAGTPAGANAIVLRSFGKFYGLAGLRLGFVIASADFTATLHRVLGDWPVSADALAAGLAAYADVDWAERTLAHLHEEAARLDEHVIRAGFEVVGGTALFRLARAPDAPAWFMHLACAGVLVRPFSYNPELLRFGLPGSRAAWQRLTSTLVRSHEH
jgi:cobalamin biosynthesis protein CobC